MIIWQEGYTPRGWIRGNRLVAYKPKYRGHITYSIWQHIPVDFDNLDRPMDVDATACIHVTRPEHAAVNEWYRWWMNDPTVTLIPG